MSVVLIFKFKEVLFIFHLKVLTLLLLIHEQKLTQLGVLTLECPLLQYIKCLDVLGH